MTRLFLNIVNSSIAASWLVLVVLVLRALLKKAPRWTNVMLWGLVAVRLLCPISVESAWSLIPSVETISKEILAAPKVDIQGNVIPVAKEVRAFMGERNFGGVMLPSDTGRQVLIVFSVIWLIGVFLLLAYMVFSFLRLRKQVETAVLLQRNIYQSEQVKAPFVLGLIQPKIYIPFHVETQQLHYVIAHEQAHIRRLDYLWKPLGYMLVTVHWFNPLLWFSYLLLCKDIEQACDEKAIRKMDREQRAEYSQLLLSYTTDYKRVTACPLAFGEVAVKERVKAILNYVKPAGGMIAAVGAMCVIVALCFLTNPKTIPQGENGEVIVTTALIKNFTGKKVDVDLVEYLLREDKQRINEIIKELGVDKELFLQGNFLDGYYIHNPEAEYMTYPLAETVSFSFIDWGRDFSDAADDTGWVDTTDKELFQKYLHTYTNATPGMPFYIEIKDGEIVGIIEIPMA